MIKKVIKNLSLFLIILLFYNCSVLKNNDRTFTEINDHKDSTADISRIKFIKNLDYSDFKEGKFDDKNLTVNYRLLKPKTIAKNKKYPLVLVFHGSGAIGTNNTSQMGVLSKMWLLPENREKHPVYVLSPQFPVRSSNYHLDENRNVQVSESNEYLDLVLNSVDSLSKTENIDENKIYVIGFSMGGATVMNAISKRPDLFAAAINISGISEFSNEINLKKLPIWIVHGGLDTDNKPESNLKFYDEMKNSGNVKFWKYKDKYHNNILSAELVKEIPQWIFKYKK
ncbi:carboxylesterase family protein [Frigoriflavimonas asaccharolytica]|uniref:Putative peptidase n=1 Tax=Frigoriflavimonas asaccharolytica TaxID=2735899 RepID=A0A8J8G960_9FLAO|nr:alpha/beta hydrolase-fold protein [Frigoriflavimonas asaccharolytica]NRS92247.1 putative peptidase [Frigoriflavimonas asaccharolytica]